MTYEDALALMHEYVKNEALRKHMYAVEAAMKSYAHKFGEEEEKWAVTGLLHDFDFEQFPGAPEHTAKGAEILRGKGWPEDIVTAIQGHASYSGVQRTTRMAKTLYACDELCGFIAAVAVIRPNKIMDLELSSVKKKMKTTAFAKNISREDIIQGASELGIPLDDHIAAVIGAMKGSAERLGLA